MRARSALDVALWDILGQVCRQPLYQLLGGAVRDRLPVYNTRAGYSYVRKSRERYIEKNPAAGAPAMKAAGPYEDLRVGIATSLPICPKSHTVSSNRSPVPDSALNCCRTWSRVLTCTAVRAAPEEQLMMCLTRIKSNPFSGAHTEESLG
jgi:L-alanine-DL-glutamate epimerase-like enolase superfamily enzyme